MARLAILTDRLPRDPSWKGAVVWQIIRHLAESQHEVAVFTTESPEQISFTHSRLTVARPAPSFGVERLPRFAQALISYRPEVIHTFAVKRSSLWPSLTLWPYLDAVCRVLPGVRRVTTMFEAEDFAATGAAELWYQGSDQWTVFSPSDESRARARFAGRIEVAPLEEMAAISPVLGPSAVDVLEGDGFDTGFEDVFTLVPAPVSEWPDPRRGVERLAAYLLENAHAVAHINGGWGELTMSERRHNWSVLGEAAARVRLLEPLDLERACERVRAARTVWTTGLAPDSWRHLLSQRLAEAAGKELIGAAPVHALPQGSTANFLSRLYVS